jgi:hypothetical protein
MRGTAVGATGDALREFNEALSAGVNFEARDYSSIVRGFSPQNHKLIGCCRAAISNLWLAGAPRANRIKRLGSPCTCRTAPLSVRLAPALWGVSRTCCGDATRASGIYTPARPTIMPGSYAGPSASLPSSRGPGHSPLKASTPVRIRLGAPFNQGLSKPLDPRRVLGDSLSYVRLPAQSSRFLRSAGSTTYPANRR